MRERREILPLIPCGCSFYSKARLFHPVKQTVREDECEQPVAGLRFPFL